MGHGVTRTYDADHHPATVLDAKNQLTVYAYNAADEQTTVTRPDGTVLSNEYDPAGNLTVQRDGKNNPTTYGYDALNRQVSVTDPLNRVTGYGYDRAGNSTTLTDPQGQVTTHAYDAADQPTSITYSDGATPNVSFVYDADGQRASMADGTGTTTYAYDSLHRLTRSADGAAQTVAYGYDLKGQQTTLTYPNGQVETRVYDDAGRLASTTDWLGQTTPFTYDEDANHTTTASPNGVTTTTGFDNADRPASMAHTRSGAAVAGFSYGRDNTGLLTSTATTGLGQPDEAYTYTALDQLKTVNTATYDYDTADNLTKQASGATLGYDAANQATSHIQGGVTTTLAYDTRGNRIASTPPSSLGTSYLYDQANRLTTVTSESWATAKGSVGAGSYHTLAVMSNGTVWAWGANFRGQLGDGTSTDSRAPVQVSGLTGVVGVAAGASHSLAVKADGTVWAWGSNYYGQLGNATTTTTSSPIPVQVIGLSGVVAVAAGQYHSLWP